MNKLKQWPLHIIMVSMLLMLVGSILFYKERMLFVDPAWVCSEIINNSKLCISENRIGAFITQMFPYFASKLGFSLKGILISYSLSFNLFYCFTGWLVGYKFKQSWLAICLGFYFLLFVGDVYYWTNNEVHQGVTWMCLGLGYYQYSLESKKLPWYAYFTILLCLALGVSCHLLVMLPLLFIWFFMLLQSKDQYKAMPITWIATTICILLFITTRYLLSRYGWYDQAKLQSVININYKSIFNSFTSGQMTMFLKLCFQIYWLAPILFLGSLVVTIRKKKWLTAALIVGFTLGYLVLISLTFPDAWGRDLRFYMESEYMALTFIIVLPLIYHLHQNQHFIAQTLVILAICIIGCIHIMQSYPYFKYRLAFINHIQYRLEQKGIHKAILTNVPGNLKHQLIMDWGLPVESMMLSKLKQQTMQTTFLVERPGLENSSQNNTFHSCFSTIHQKHLNQLYFQLDSTQLYQLVDINELTN